jgi:hypothetical protein
VSGVPGIEFVAAITCLQEVRLTGKRSEPTPEIHRRSAQAGLLHTEVVDAGRGRQNRHSVQHEPPLVRYVLHTCATGAVAEAQIKES